MLRFDIPQLHLLKAFPLVVIVVAIRACIPSGLHDPSHVTTSNAHSERDHGKRRHPSPAESRHVPQSQHTEALSNPLREVLMAQDVGDASDDVAPGVIASV